MTRGWRRPTSSGLMPTSARSGNSRTRTVVVHAVATSVIQCLLSRADGVAEQAGNSHRANAARHRGYRLRMVQFVCRAVAHQFGPAVMICNTGYAHIRSEEQTSELQSLMRKSYAVFCLKK